MRPSEAFPRMPRAARGAVRMALRVAVAAALTIGTVPARSDAPGAKTLGNSVLPALPEPPNGAATPAVGAGCAGPVRGERVAAGERAGSDHIGGAFRRSGSSGRAAFRRGAARRRASGGDCRGAPDTAMRADARRNRARNRSARQRCRCETPQLGRKPRRTGSTARHHPASAFEARRTTPTLPMHYWSSGCGPRR